MTFRRRIGKTSFVARLESITVRDALGREVEIPRRPARVVSLVPSITETLFELGAGDSLVAITDFCIFPAERVRDLPRVGGTKTPGIDAIRALEPQLVYMNLEENLRRHAEQIGEFTTIFASEPRNVVDVIDLIRVLGEIHGGVAEAARWSVAIKDEADGLRSSAAFTFAVPIWKDPWMWCGGDTYVSGLIESAGGANVLRSTKRYPHLPPASVLQERPDVVFLPDEPYRFEDADRAHLQDLGFSEVTRPFPGHLVTWHGTRTLAGLRFLREWRRRGQ